MPGSIPAEEEASIYYQRIHNLATDHRCLSVDELLKLLRLFKKSQVAREREVFECVLKNLFEEYRHFPAYPIKELTTNAHLFGGIIKHGLVPNQKALGIAFLCILEALINSPNSKMYHFGITALNGFKHHLNVHRQFCLCISRIPCFKKFPKHIIEYIEFGRNEQEPPSSTQIVNIPDDNGVKISQRSFASEKKNISQNQNTMTTTTASTDSSIQFVDSTTDTPCTICISSSTEVYTLPTSSTKPTANIITPDENVREKIVFIFNNLNEVNIQTKCTEIQSVIGRRYLPWLSRYLVKERVSTEGNLHALYSKMLDHINSQVLNSSVVSETYTYIRILLRRKKGTTDTSNRPTLMKLGNWLGMITLAKNKPILLDDMDLKMILVNAYNGGLDELLFTVPFIAKVLKSCATSNLFKPKNPWTMTILNCLCELHQVPGLKLTLKFEIEILCRNLNIKLTDLNPGSVLSDPQPRSASEP